MMNFLGVFTKKLYDYFIVKCFNENTSKYKMRLVTKYIVNGKRKKYEDLKNSDAFLFKMWF